MKNKILIPVESPDFSLQIIPQIKSMFDPEDITLILLHVEEEPELIHIERPGFEALDVFVDTQMFNQRSRFRVGMHDLVNALESEGFTVETEVLFGEPTERIDDAVRDYNVDLVAMVTHGRHGWERIRHGSVAEHVVRHTNVPVLLLHSEVEPVPA
ncbi:MAG: universal stress protein [Caldilineaceae bacterium]